MSKLKERLNFVLYVITLVVAIIIVYRAFFYGFRKGEFIGTYYPPQEKSALQAEVKKPVDLRKLRVVTDEQVNEGRRLFKLNCASCHGETGFGDGPKSAGLNPPPRNFHREKFKYGSSPLQIYNTISNGVPGTSMPAFDLLAGEDRMAMAHFVRTFVAAPPDDPQELVDALPVVEEGSESSTGQQDSGDESNTMLSAITVEQAQAQYLAQRGIKPVSPTGIGRNPVFNKYCASCHGSFGEGKTTAEHVVPSAVIYLDAGVLAGREIAVVSDKKTFEKFITDGTPGLKDHRFGCLSKAEINDLYNFVIILTNIK